ncbi:hypothetical protein Tco_0458188 [Tanacetum coccineum]
MLWLHPATNPNAGQEHDTVAPSQPSSSTPLVPSTSSPPVLSAPTPIPATIPSPTPIPETEPEPFEHIFEEPSPVHPHFSPPQEQAPSQMSMDDLLQAVPELISRIDSLETDLKQTKLTMGNAIVKLVKKVKNQDDPLDSSVQGLVTPSTTKVNALREEQVEDISPNTLEAAKTLSKVASLKQRSIDKGRRYKRRKEAKGKKVVSSLDFQEEVNTGAEQVNTAEGVNTGSIKLSTVSEQLSTEEASLAEAIRLDSLQKEEEAKQTHLDSLLAQRIAEEEELNEQQKKRKAQVYMLGSKLPGEDFAKKMVDLINQRKKYFAEERAKAKRNKPMTQSQLKTYMMNYLMNQGTWKLSQLKNLSFEEVKEEFDKLIKTLKRLKNNEAKDDELTKKSGKRRKQMARRGLHTDLDKDDSEDSDEVGKQEESVTGTKTPINPIPVAMKIPSIDTYKIIKQGEKGVYQIVREDGTDVVYINFGAMLKDISRDDLTELYRI